MDALSRKRFLELLGASAAAAAFQGCCSQYSCRGVNAKQALQLFSIRTYIRGKKDKDGKEISKGVGLAQALKDVAAIGFTGVEFAGYYGNDAKTVKAMLDDAGLVACGTHVSNSEYGFDTDAWKFDADVLKKTCAFNLGYGNDLIICPGGGNIPPGCSWSVVAELFTTVSGQEVRDIEFRSLPPVTIRRRGNVGTVRVNEEKMK